MKRKKSILQKGQTIIPHGVPVEKRSHKLLDMSLPSLENHLNALRQQCHIAEQVLTIRKKARVDISRMTDEELEHYIQTRQPEWVFAGYMLSSRRTQRAKQEHTVRHQLARKANDAPCDVKDVDADWWRTKGQ